MMRTKYIVIVAVVCIVIVVIGGVSVTDRSPKMHVEKPEAVLISTPRDAYGVVEQKETATDTQSFIERVRHSFTPLKKEIETVPVAESTTEYISTPVEMPQSQIEVPVLEVTPSTTIEVVPVS